MRTRIDPFAEVSEREVLWQETVDVSKEVRAKSPEPQTGGDRTVMSAEEVSAAWRDYHARKKQKTLEKPGE